MDSQQQQVQVRSQPPQRAPQASFYYEVLVAPQAVTLRRFSAPKGQPRELIPMHLTREVAMRLVQDIGEAGDLQY
jgi:hypothetical protein